MNNRVKEILKGFKIGSDGIYGIPINTTSQSNEISLREQVANKSYVNYLSTIANSHSIPVMDHEVKRALKLTPHSGIIIDIGGCWGWHWRNLEQDRPDVIVILVDFIHSNLQHAKQVLGKAINNKIFLVCCDATMLPIPANSFDLYWSVQTLQHIPNFSNAVQEGYRVLKSGGFFINYSLNNALLVKLIYSLFRKRYHIEGNVSGYYYLARANKKQRNLIKKIFNNNVKERYCEIFFQPDLKLKISREKSIIGLFDSKISGSFFLWKWIARQRVYQTIK